MNAIGVDIGGTKIAAAVVTPEGELLNEVRYPTQAIPPHRLIETIARAITEVKDGFEVGGACLAVPGFVLTAENKVILAPNLHEIEDIPLDEEIGGRTGLRVSVENDANAAGWGEFRFGAGKGIEHMIFVTLGTGVGGGVITHGVLSRGVQGAGGELGHVTTNPTGPRCGCGNPVPPPNATTCKSSYRPMPAEYTPVLSTPTSRRRQRRPSSGVASRR